MTLQFNSLLCVYSHVQQVVSEPNSYSKTNRLKRKMTSNTFSDKRSFLNTPPPFNGDRFELWKVRFKFFIKRIDLELWEILINGPFIPTHHINSEVVDKLNFLWTVEKMGKFKIYFKANNFLLISLDDRKLLYVYNYKSSKEI